MFEPGKSGNPEGKKPGTLNKSTRAVKEALEECFDRLGGVAAMEQWARREPTEFFKLLAKLLPRDIRLDVAERLEDLIARALMPMADPGVKPPDPPLPPSERNAS